MYWLESSRSLEFVRSIVVPATKIPRMANNDNSDYFANWNRFAGYQQVQPQYKTSRFAFAPVYGSFNESHYFSGRAPIAQMTPAPGQVPGSSMLETYPITHQTTGYHDISGPTDASAPNSPSDSPDSPTSTASSRTVVESPTKRGSVELQGPFVSR